jgi:hypothetical protein
MKQLDFDSPPICSAAIPPGAIDYEFGPLPRPFPRLTAEYWRSRIDQDTAVESIH